MLCIKSPVSMMDKNDDRKLDILISLSSKKLLMSLIIIPNLCVDNNAQILILYRDGKRSDVTTHSEFNCKGRFSMFLNRPYSQEITLEKLLEKEIDTIRLYTVSDTYDFELSKEDSFLIKQVLNCLYQKSKE